jgi:uncharacterized membrane protein (DUF2068 family)
MWKLKGSEYFPNALYNHLEVESKGLWLTHSITYLLGIATVVILPQKLYQYIRQNTTSPQAKTSLTVCSFYAAI